MDIQLRNFLVWIYLTISICLIQSTWSDNISRGKTTTQLGTWDRNSADRAVDGDTNQNLDQGSCAHPHGLDSNVDAGLRGDSTWWSVDLSNGDVAKFFMIENVTIYFRECCPERIRGARILVGNTSNVAVQQECAYISQSEYMQTLLCKPSTAVRFLTIEHPTQASLGLCEVIVNGYQYQVAVCPAGFFGRNCDSTCNCRDTTETCDPGDGHCPNGCKAGYTNRDCSTKCTGFKFGVGCAFDCNCDDLNEKCEPVTGGCPQSGCDEDYWGSNCSIPLPVIRERPTRRSENETSVTIQFQRSFPRADEYLVEYAMDRVPVQYSSGVIVPDTNEYWYTVTQGQLTPTTNYRLRVVPYISSRRGGESDPLYITTSTPRRPSIRDAPRERTSTSTSITVEFQASDPVADTYQVEYRAQGATDFMTGPTVSHVQGQTQVATLDGLQPDTEYTIRITPISPGVEGLSSPVVYLRTKSQQLPSIRDTPRMRTTTSTSITVEFQASDPVADTYLVEYRARGAGDFMTGPVVSHVQGQTQVATLDGLQPDTDYQIKITPILKGVQGTSSDVLIRTKTLELPAIKDAPKEGSSTTSSITVQFKASDPIAEQYRVEYKAQGAAAFMTGPVVNHAQGQTQVATIEDLQPETTYEIRIIPITQGMEGPSSPVANIMTEKIYVVLPTLTTTTGITTTDDDGDVEKTTEEDSSNGGMIAGIIVVIIILIIIIIAFLLYRRKKSGKPIPGSSRFGSMFARLKPSKLGSEVDPGDKPAPPEISGPVHNPEDPPDVRVIGHEYETPPSTPMPSVPPTPDPKKKKVPTATLR